MIIGMARAIGETRDHHRRRLTFIAFSCPRTESTIAPTSPSLAATLHGDADPDLQLDLTSGSRVPADAAAAGAVLGRHDLTMNGLAIWLRYRRRKNLEW